MAINFQSLKQWLLYMISITKAPTDQLAFKDKLYYSSACRVGFRHFIKHLDFGDQKILLPGYIGISVNEGSGVFDPIAEYQIGYEFYKVKEDLSTDLVDFKARILNGNVKAALVIHYFGFLQSDIKTIAELCRENNVLLIEDCAHTLTSTYEGTLLGQFGDVGLFSLHKILPVPDGGILRINNGNYFSIPPLSEEDRISQTTLEAFCASRLDQVSEVRRRNYLLLAAYLADLNGIEVMYPELPDRIVPQSFPILIKNLSREKVYFAMIEKGVRVIALYYKLIEQISAQEHPISYDISNRILNLPIHQDLTQDNLRLIAKSLHEVLHSLL